MNEDDGFVVNVRFFLMPHEDSSPSLLSFVAGALSSRSMDAMIDGWLAIHGGAYTFPLFINFILNSRIKREIEFSAG